MSFVNRTFFLLIASCFLLVATAFGQQTDTPTISYSLGRFANPDTMTGASVFRSSGGVVRNTRGVLFQAMAGFARFDAAARDWYKVHEDEISVVGSESGYCVKIANAPCAALPFSAAEIKAISAFVRRGDGRAMSLALNAPDASYQGQIESELADAGLIKVEGASGDEIWVAREFAPHERLVFLLEALDRTNIFSANIKQQELERFRLALNRNLASTLSSAELVDQSWLVSDVGANLVLLHENGRLRCSGYPTRAEWEIRSGNDYAHITNVKALEGTEAIPTTVSTLDTLLEMENPELASMGRALICTTAAFRALHHLAPTKLTTL